LIVTMRYTVSAWLGRNLNALQANSLRATRHARNPHRLRIAR